MPPSNTNTLPQGFIPTHLSSTQASHTLLLQPTHPASQSQILTLGDPRHSSLLARPISPPYPANGPYPIPSLLGVDIDYIVSTTPAGGGGWYTAAFSSVDGGMYLFGGKAGDDRGPSGCSLMRGVRRCNRGTGGQNGGVEGGEEEDGYDGEDVTLITIYDQQTGQELDLLSIALGSDHILVLASHPQLPSSLHPHPHLPPPPSKPTIYALGRNNEGQLGYPPPTSPTSVNPPSHWTPTWTKLILPLSTDESIASISAGGWSSLILVR